MTDGAGVSVVLDCAGVKVGLEAGMEKRLYAKVFDGRIPCSRWFAQFGMPLAGFMLKEITEDFQQVVEAFKGTKYFDAMVSCRLLTYRHSPQ